MTRLELETHGILVQTLSVGGAGPTVVVKDCIDVAGYPTRCGSRIFAEAAPAIRHASVVVALLEAGCRILGKANMHELAYGVTGVNSWTGTPPNPRYGGRVPGGSSSGSAVAVAAGRADFALGTDTGGSIRLPAVCCGVYGLKPTFGRIPRDGAYPTETSLDCIGPIARDVATLERAMSIIAPRYQACPPPTTVRLGVVAAEVDPEVASAVKAALSLSGFELRSVELPTLEAAYEAGFTIMAAEMFSSFGRYCGSGLLGADVEARLQAAARVTVAQRGAAEAVRTRFAREVDAALTQADALALATLPAVPPMLEQAGDARMTLRLTTLVRPFNLSGHPALTIPLETAHGNPAGLQLVGPMQADEPLCAIATCLTKALQ